LVRLKQNEASSDSGHGTTVAIIEARQHQQHSGAAQQAVSASATQTSQGEEAVETASSSATPLCSALTGCSCCDK